MNIELIINKIMAWTDEYISRLVGYTTWAITFFGINITQEVLHYIFTVASAVSSFLFIEYLKRKLKKKHEKKNE